VPAGPLANVLVPGLPSAAEVPSSLMLLPFDADALSMYASLHPACRARAIQRRAASGERPVSRSTLSTKGDRPPILAAVVVEVAGYERLSSVFSRPPGRGRRFGSARRRTRGRQRTDWPQKTTLGSWPSKPCDVSGRWRINPHTRPSSQATAGEQGRTMAAEGSRTWRRG